MASTGDLQRNTPRTWWQQRIGSIAIAISVLLLPLFIVPGSSAATTCAPGANAIVCENSKPGSPWQDWDIIGAGDDTIQGFATDISVNVGQKVDFKIDTDASDYTIDIYRTGWYQGLGARKIASVTPSAKLPQKQPECLWDVTTELTDCGTWSVSASWQVPPDAVSGVYLAKLTRKDTGGASHVTFIVRDESSHAAVLFQTSDPTWEAYNTYGGSDFYSGGANGRAYKVSYNRPFATRGGVEARDFYFGAEYPMVRFMERNGYDVSYFSGVDTDRHGPLLKNHKVFLSVGHDEYWSSGQRKNVEAARDAGVNLQFLSGNEVYWHTRYEPSATGGNNYRTLVSYKETWANTKIDPTSEWTGTWRDPRYAAAADGAGSPENALTGTAYMVNHDDLPITVNDREGKLRLWRNTSLTAASPNTRTELAPHTVGYESDEDVPNGFRPPGLIKLSTTTGAVPEYLQDFGNNVKPGETTHNLTLYRAASGALVFGAGTVQWTWGLDQWHDGDGAPEDSRMQQAQVNLLADMGAQPQTLMDGLTAATASSDKTAPSVNIVSAPSGKIANGDKITIKGTARDIGGQVAGVEYSVDGGNNWKAADGTASWSFTTVQHGIGAGTILVRAIDDSANYPQTATSVPVNVTGPYTVFGSIEPTTPDSGDATAAEFGLRFTPTTDGFIAGVRFYKSTSNTGTHTGSLWSVSGSQLASATFTNETSSGWQSVTFDEPVAVSAGTGYVISYSAPKGHYTADSQYFAYRGVVTPPMRVSGGFGTLEAGVYDTGGNFPATSYLRSNYFVDPIFETLDGLPLTAGGHTPADTAVSVSTTAAIGATLSKPVAAQNVSITVKGTDGNTVAGTTAFDTSTQRATFTPNAALAEGTNFTATIRATDSSGHSVGRGGSWSFRTVLPTPVAGACPCGLFPDSKTPTMTPIQDGVPVTLGTRFSAETSGTIDGLEYYRIPEEQGPHTGRLYSMSGTVLGEVTFNDDSVSGWQYSKFTSPIRIKTGTEYVVAYDSKGTYSATPGDFTAPVANGPLHTSERAGQFTYSSGAFPNQQIDANYLVDVRFTADPPPVSIIQRTPTADAYEVAPASAISMTFNEALKSGYKVSVTTQGNAIAGTTALSSDSRKLTFTPASDLPEGSKIDVAVTDIVGASSGSADIESWSFRTTNVSNPLQSYLGNAQPDQTDPQDKAAVGLGMRLKTSKNIDVRAIRFYKGPLTSGTHTGALWAADGSRLATVTFSHESAGGWQTAFLNTPVSIPAGTSFTVSYYAPNGGYVYTSAGLAGSPAKGALSLDGDNGLFAYGNGASVPSNSWNSSNYFADVLYTQEGPASPTASQSATSSPASTQSPSTSPSPSSSPSTSPGASPTSSPTPSPTQSAGAGLPEDVSWLMDHSSAPAGASTTTDNLPLELGLGFTVSEPITVFGLGFEKSAQNGGEHNGYLYAEDGTVLGSTRFTGEMTSGWQQAAFDNPVILQPGSYTISYYAPQGGYTSKVNTDFTSLDSGPINVASTNGRYRYGNAGGTVPTETWQSSNYFVDLAYKLNG